MEDQSNQQGPGPATTSKDRTVNWLVTGVPAAIAVVLTLVHTLYGWSWLATEDKLKSDLAVAELTAELVVGRSSEAIAERTAELVVNQNTSAVAEETAIAVVDKTAAAVEMAVKHAVEDSFTGEAARAASGKTSDLVAQKLAPEMGELAKQNEQILRQGEASLDAVEDAIERIAKIVEVEDSVFDIPAMPINVEYKGDNSSPDRKGYLGFSTQKLRPTDALNVRVDLGHETWFYLIHLELDGSMTLVSPEEEYLDPLPLKNIKWPAGGDALFSDEEGAQAFLLIASASPLEPFEDFKRKSSGFVWSRSDVDFPLVYDGKDFSEFDQSRGVRKRDEVPGPLYELCKIIKQDWSKYEVRAIIFPIKKP